ncbi:MAG: peptidoglycan DD-metalloendopeptidase family protein [Bacteroidales bacterium]|nr:peptidoglycan DD-metalloendopeptidase family protein [Bacteroidales bacterium]
MRYLSPIFSFILIISLLFSCTSKENDNKDKDLVIEKDRFMYDIRINDFDVIRDTLKQGENLASLLYATGLNGQEVHAIVQKCDSVFSVRKFKKGNIYTKMFSDSTLVYFVYDIDVENYLLINLSDSIPQVTKQQKEVYIEERHAKGTIETSLWNAMVDNNMDPNIAIALSEMYAWSIDFFGLQKGDSFKVVYTEKFVDSVSVGLESVKYAVFNHIGQDCYSIPFEQDGIVQYFDENGKSTRKAFLKAPLRYSRISSHFSNGRRHPILKIVRPHHGVDYAAPAGTPVQTIGDGVVVKKGYSGGAGNMITIKHNASYTTTYMHLQRFAKGISTGSRVHQGQVIGYVGSTGLSTGPHLDFRVYKNGTPIDPLRMVSPPTNPVKEKDMPAFKHIADSLVHILQSF